MFFNYDIYLLNVASGAIRQLTQTRSNEYRPVWSPDGRFIAYEGLKRPMTSSETNSEDTHVWTVDVGTGGRREVGAAVDNRQGAPQWSADGQQLFATVQSQGGVGLFEFSPRDGAAVRVLRKAPLFTAVTVASLALAIGANATIFSLLNTLVLRPIHVRDPHSLVELTTATPSSSEVNLSYPLFEELKRDGQVLANVIAWTGTAVINVEVRGTPPGMLATQ